MYEQRKLVCDDCREANPSTLSCIHTWGPRLRKSTIASEANAVPGVIPPPESDDKTFRTPLVDRSRAVMPANRRVIDVHDTALFTGRIGYDDGGDNQGHTEMTEDEALAAHDGMNVDGTNEA